MLEFIKSFFSHLLLTGLAICVQSFMLLQVGFFYVVMKWKNRKPIETTSIDYTKINFGTCTMSIIIPMRNEAENVEGTLKRLSGSCLNASLIEVVIVDSESTDDTIARAKEVAPSLPFKNIAFASATGGRGPTLDAGVQVASGELLFFVHADCQVPKDFDSLLREALSNPNNMAAAFTFAIDRSKLPNSYSLPGMTTMEQTVYWRSSVLQLPFGDQGIAIIKKSLIEKYNSFEGAKYPIMEDFKLVQQMRVEGCSTGRQIAILPQKICCSPRRWLKMGVWRTNLINQLVMLWYRSGATTQQLFDFYYRKSTEGVPKLLMIATYGL